MNRLRDALRNDVSEVSLDVAALELARIEFPAVDISACLSRLDQLAEQIGSTLPGHVAGLEFINRMNEVLFDILGFEGNRDEYYDPRNSCLNSVLTRRLGIPITLSLMYMEVGRRLSQNIYGVGLPGHFIVAYETSASRYWVDPFHRGRILSFADCCELAKQTGRVDIRANGAALAPVTKRQILVRMLNNLKAIYLRGSVLEKARMVLDLLIEAIPGYPEEYRCRGMVHLRLSNHQAAKADLETYLRLEPDSPEREQVERELILIEHWKAGLN